jgi:hypothetical protein
MILLIVVVVIHNYKLFFIFTHYKDKNVVIFIAFLFYEVNYIDRVNSF